MSDSTYPTDHPLDGRGADTATEIVGRLDLRAASPAVWSEVEAMRVTTKVLTAENTRLSGVVADVAIENDKITAALCACITRLEDLGDGDGPTAKLARNALREAAL
jgi:hypothetical protein